MENYNTKDILEMIDSGESLVLDFWAEWCQPCKAFIPTFENVSQNEDFKDKVKFIKVNVDLDAELSIKYGIRGIPTVLFIKDGVVKEKNVGAMNKSSFETFVSKNITS